MADIIPVNTSLPQIQEGGAVSQSFSAQLAANETLVDLKITKYESTDGIIVGDTSFSGTYNSVFSFEAGALKYRQGDELKTASSWDELPADSDLYEWIAPRSLKRTFSYTVVMTYNITTETSTGESGGTSTTVQEQTITKTYTQLVYGNWNKWADKLRAHVYARG
ncbi:hypothetical protein KNT87_gp269 [Erwinia phage Cronus]|uniref:Uncharacterized protein n=1 Tax=Erwinia phage Cronus TaxID=2163633 RepID=A0A2S1GLP0_9CAUD|nr:hypothetical protein KNT87_gp269 [Erwinia phage Cronus]AWD90300.1 hypothetical protein [Erwinia phage Cronus]